MPSARYYETDIVGNAISHSVEPGRATRFVPKHHPRFDDNFYWMDWLSVRIQQEKDRRQALWATRPAVKEFAERLHQEIRESVHRYNEEFGQGQASIDELNNKIIVHNNQDTGHRGEPEVSYWFDLQNLTLVCRFAHVPERNHALPLLQLDGTTAGVPELVKYLLDPVLFPNLIGEGDGY